MLVRLDHSPYKDCMTYRIIAHVLSSCLIWVLSQAGSETKIGVQIVYLGNGKYQEGSRGNETGKGT